MTTKIHMLSYIFRLIILCLLISLNNTYAQINTNSEIKKVVDSLNNHNQLIKSYEDSLSLIQNELRITQEKLDSNEQLISNWAVYSGILAGFLIVITLGSSFIVARRAKDVAFEELRESKDEIKKDLELIKDMKLKANVAFAEFSTALGLLRDEANKKANGSE